MPTYFPIKTTPFEAQTLADHPQRSHSIHRIVKHCFEATFLDSAPSYHIGFSPYPDKRAMVSFLRESKKSTSLFEYQGPGSSKNYLNRSSIDFVIEETRMVCLDSLERKIYTYQGSDHRSSSYSYFTDAKEWHAFFDGSTQSRTESVKLSINLGFKPFTNTLPNGFYPWIYDIDSFQGIKKKEISHHSFYDMKCFLAVLFSNLNK